MREYMEENPGHLWIKITQENLLKNWLIVKNDTFKNDPFYSVTFGVPGQFTIWDTTAKTNMEIKAIAAHSAPPSTE